MKTKTENQSPSKFAEGLCFKKLFFVFLVGSIIGTIYEDLLIGFTTGEWITHRGVIYGPFNVIYGFGAAIICFLMLRKPYKNWQIFLYSALLGGVTEYLLSLGQELVLGTRSWDYTGWFLSLNGRTTIPVMLVWGVMSLLLVKIIYPVLSRLIEKIPIKIGNVVFVILLVLIIFDMLISWSALIRQNLRHSGVKAISPVGEFLDKTYPDEKLRKYYGNMERKN